MRIPPERFRWKYDGKFDRFFIRKHFDCSLSKRMVGRRGCKAHDGVWGSLGFIAICQFVFMGFHVLITLVGTCLYSTSTGRK